MGPRVIQSSALRMALSYVLFGVIALAVFAAPIWYGWRVSIQEGRTELLREDSQRQVVVFNRDGVDGLVHFIDERISLQIVGERILLLTDPRGRILAGNLSEWPDSVPPQSGTYRLTIPLEGHPAQVMLVRTELPGGYRLLVGRDLSRYTPIEDRFWYGLVAALLLLTAMGAIGTVLIRRELLTRVQGIRQTVSAIMQGDLSHRLQPDSRGDELDILSETINRMLDQIELLVSGVRNVSNSITHDLRTPLAELRSRLEELLLTRPDETQTFIEVESAVADVDRVISIFNALLRLAEIDSGLRRSGFVDIDIVEVVAQAVEFYSPAAEVKNIALTFRGDNELRIAGDPLLLAQAASNLIDNALKYSPTGGAVAIEVRTSSEGIAELVVTDNGPGIPDDDKPHVTERFYRGDVSRNTVGMGLGLSTVEAVARLHGGSLELGDRRPGLEVRMRIAARA
jgi:signal transduction histidine kinase